MFGNVCDCFRLRLRVFVALIIFFWHFCIDGFLVAGTHRTAKSTKSVGPAPNLPIQSLNLIAHTLVQHTKPQN